MSKNNKQITIEVPSSILEIEELNHLEKLMLSVTYTYSKKKLGFNSLSNKDFSEMLGVDVNSLGNHRKRLVELGYETKEKGGIYRLTDKVDQKYSSNKMILLPPQVYSLRKLKAGAKLLWSVYNSLSKGTTGYCNAKRETLAERLQCSEDSITNWHQKLEERELLFSSSLAYGKNTKQRRVKTKDFNKVKEVEVVEPISKKETLLDKREQSETTVSSNTLESKKHLKGLQTMDHLNDGLYWKSYMSEMGYYDLSNKVDLEDFCYEVIEKIAEKKASKHHVLPELIGQLDEKLKGKETEETIQKLKDFLTYYIE